MPGVAPPPELGRLLGLQLRLHHAQVNQTLSINPSPREEWDCSISLWLRYATLTGDGAQLLVNLVSLALFAAYSAVFLHYQKIKVKARFLELRRAPITLCLLLCPPFRLDSHNRERMNAGLECAGDFRGAVRGRVGGVVGAAGVGGVGGGGGEDGDDGLRGGQRPEPHLPRHPIRNCVPHCKRLSSTRTGWVDVGPVRWRREDWVGFEYRVIRLGTTEYLPFGMTAGSSLLQAQYWLYARALGDIYMRVQAFIHTGPDPNCEPSCLVEYLTW